MVNKLPPPILIADSPGLDFLNSVATPVDEPLDWLCDGEGLLCWLGEANLVPKQTLAVMSGQALPGELDKVADQARALREWFRTFVQSHRGRALTESDLTQLEPLNKLLERDEAFSQLTFNRDGANGLMTVERMRRWRSPESLLLPIAETLANCVCAEDFSAVKACEGSACTLLFADHTRGRGRRWCSMSICGNRAKQASHRKRLKEQSA